ncbi:NAD-dependent epimerase/dehydratase family protein [Pseudarthrobacter sp. J75]|uniref:NAD-dependent epimerase/dehydratase family protein n=1 Tax=unclassified Pseudarthrobacter TaxID=2647000 RepID=UPI002E81462F|nr:MULTISPECIES: NAD-dependent epimerase/dehydratase family protein [unclassified Pseudarthrobacter]MEE2524086.1 NAD-dependent epimerase/dehydratase family protein [Pseudarthrobacter sp. J47]MEE2530365.1 NAD-dependent epimerase/dehydratase family protein [Pseudarthrobacter sp. J75]
MSDLYVVTGAGPVGWTIAEQLADQGKTVRIATRSGSGPDHPLVERVRADVQDPAALRQLMAGATAVFHCIHAAYNAKDWEAELPRAEQKVLAAAKEAGAVVIFPESLYSYSEPGRVMTEASPRGATGGKRGVRTALLAARAASVTDTVSVVAGDFFGPRVLMAHGGERMLSAVLSGKRLQVIGSTRQPHSFTYVPDLAAAMIRAAQAPELWNKVWHAPTLPAVTQRQLAASFADAAGEPLKGVSAIPGPVLRLVGLFSADLREIAEMAYQFEKPFVMDSAASQAAFGLKPTPLPDAAAATVGWWRGSGAK